MGCQRESVPDDTPIENLTLEPGSLKLGMSLDKEPFAYLDDEQITPEGFDVECMKAIAEALGVKLEIIDTTNENLLPSLDAKIYDCAIAEMSPEALDETKYLNVESYTFAYEGDIRTIFLDKKNEQLMLRLDMAFSELLDNGKVGEISQKHFNNDITIGD